MTVFSKPIWSYIIPDSGYACAIYICSESDKEHSYQSTTIIFTIMCHDISRWTRNKEHPGNWQICFISKYCTEYWLQWQTDNFTILHTWWFWLCNCQLSFFYVVTYHFHLIMMCTSPRQFDTQEHVLRMRTFNNEANYLQKSWCCKIKMSLG
jgi:hypothetical protein